MQFREIRTTEEMKEDISLAIEIGEYTNGIFVKEVENVMKKIARADQAVAVSSGTMGLKIALDALNIKHGDMVIIPDITFIACATVVLELGAQPVFVDIDMDTYLLDQKSTLQAIVNHGDKIKAIMAVRLGGEPIPDWVYELKLPVIIDSAHSMDPIDPRAVSAVYSFHPSKIVSGIEGGCIVTNSAGDAEHMRMLRLFGFEEGTRISKALGYKGNMTNISAIVIWHNLLALEANLKRRTEIRDQYNKNLGMNRQGLGMYLYSHADPVKLMTKIPAIAHYPISLSMMLTGSPANKMAYLTCPRLISLPFHEWMTDEDVDIVCNVVKAIVL